MIMSIICRHLARLNNQWKEIFEPLRTIMTYVEIHTKNEQIEKCVRTHDDILVKQANISIFIILTTNYGIY